MDKSITYAAMDTQKKEHVVAWADPQTGEIQHFSVRNTVKEIKKMVKRFWRKAPGPVRFSTHPRNG